MLAQELMAYGLGNIVGAFFSSFSSVGSLARTAVQNDSGGKTQVQAYVQCMHVLLCGYMCAMCVSLCCVYTCVCVCVFHADITNHLI